MGIIVFTSQGNRDISDIELNFIELPKFLKKEEDLETLADKWIYFLKNAENLKVIPKNIKTEELEFAYHTVEKFGWTEAELDWYEARSRFIAARKAKSFFSLQTQV